MTKRILFLGDGIWTPSGFGTVMANIIPALAKEEELEIAILSWQYIGNKLKYGDFTLYPRNNHAMGKDSLPYAVKDFNPDVLVSLGDLWMTNYLATDEFQKNLKYHNIKWAWYVPIDTEIFPPAFKNIMHIPECVISMSQSGHNIMKEAGIRNVYLPHGVDTEVYKKLSDEEKQKIREECNLKDKFVIGFVGRNQDRKQIPRLVRAFAIMAKGKPDVHLRLHMDKFDPAGMSTDFNGGHYPGVMNCASFYGIGDKISFTDGVVHYANSLTVEQMNRVYNLFHIHASATSGEGFGLTTIEANACGVPNVITDYTSSRELTGNGTFGELVKTTAHIWGSFGTLRAMVDEEHFASKLQKMYDDWKSGGKLLKVYGQKAHEFAQGYDWKKNIVPMWKKLLLEEPELQ